MEKLVNMRMNVDRWNRKIMNICWMTAALSFVVELMLIFVTRAAPAQYLIDSVAVPTSLMLAVLILAETATRLFKRAADYIIITTSLFLASILVWAHVSLPPIHGMLFLPFIICMFYFSRSRMLFTFAISIAAVFVIYAVHPHFSNRNHLLIITAAESMVISAYFVSIHIVNRGVELVKDLRSTVFAQQELMVKNVMMDKLAKTDALTECFNHKAFHEYLDKLMEGWSGDRCVHLAILDIDNFKKINDTYGHWAGDVVLKNVARAIREEAGPNDIVARYGGEEFAVIFENRKAEDCYELMEAVRQRVERDTYPELGGGGVTVSCGLNAFMPGKGKEELFKGADEALYVSKRTGKNKVTVYGGENMTKL
ncbi:GGDEF domain-containing protein [Paenibacillus hamazuiensis]|uniref:GGDEF domain-containing protein n=1 Tax=Paenibacillus hamazuiensis TaxID=2936508 RepID=UPI00200F4482|nr:GGDEF domain-containing protein [Paenibacillus hamazuiensis]